MRIASSLLVLAVVGHVFGQTGPGGVGTSSNNVLWFRADAGVAISGTAVTGWNDRSGNGHIANPPSAAGRPTLVGSAVNGYPVISFDGSNDELRIADANSLDMTQWDIFVVGNVTSPKANNAWFCKGTNSQPNYAMWSTANNSVQMPMYDILGNLTSLNTTSNVAGSAYSLFQYNCRPAFGFLPVRTLYKGATLIDDDINLLNIPAANGNMLYIGNAQGATGWNLNGNMAEIILFKGPINSAQRLIVNNYLSAKYALPLNSGNIYVHDNTGYDHDVAGIGRISSANTQTDSRGTGIVRISSASNLGDNEFLLWGHDNGALGAWGSTDFPMGLEGRWPRMWRVNEVNQSGSAVDVGSVSITFDLTGQGPVTTSDLRLLVDANNNGIFGDDVPIAGATSLGSNLYRFSGVTALSNNLRFTLGTMNWVNTPLPVELLFFTAKEMGTEVMLDWATATERNNHHFTIERSPDTRMWDDIDEVAGAGNSIHRLDYATWDRDPLAGTSYYRLRQTDEDGTVTRSSIVSIERDNAPEVTIFPNPASTSFTVLLPEGGAPFDLLDVQGRPVHPVMVRYLNDRAEVDVSGSPPGIYTLRFNGNIPARRVSVVGR